VELYDGSVSSSFDYTIFRYGGKYGTGLYKKAMLYAETAPTISNSIFEYSKAYGVSLYGSSAVVSSNTFRFNTGTSFSTGLYAQNGKGGSISNNQFSDNATGLATYGFTGDIKDNTFTDNSTKAFGISGAFLGTLSGNSGSGNNSNTIDLQNTITSAGATTTLSANPMPYFLSGPVTVAGSSALVFEDGAIITANLIGSSGKLFVNGRLETEGPLAGETGVGVTFTSTSAVETKGAWNGITMNSGSTSHLRGTNINGAKLGIKYTSSTGVLDNVSFTNNTKGIEAYSPSSITATDVTFTNNTTDTTPSGLW